MNLSRVAAVALRQAPDKHGASMFIGAPGLTTELLRLAARQAGVHLYSDTDCNIYANGPFIALHASQDGPVALDTGNNEPVIDLLSGNPLGTGPSVTLDLKRGETRVLKTGK